MTQSERLTWRDVRDRVRSAIQSGDYAPGDRLPRDIDLAEKLNCSRSTVQRAMQDLADSGLIERRRKGGTRVRHDPVTRTVLDIPIARREIEQKGGRYGYQLIRRTVGNATRQVLGTFEVTGPHAALRVEALHLSDGRPYIFEDRWISIETAPEIGDVDLARENANEWLVRNRPYSRCDVRFYAMRADARLADLLGTEPGAALLVIERTTWIEDAPITTVKAIGAPGYEVLTRG